MLIQRNVIHDTRLPTRVADQPAPRASTRAVHGGTTHRKDQHSLTTPIFQTATFTFANTAELLEYINDPAPEREEYGRYGNPTINAVEQKIATLDGGGEAVLFSSGMTAVTSTMLACLSTGAHLVMTHDCYRRTRQFCQTVLPRLGIETSVVPMGDYDALEAEIHPGQTAFIISESPTNPYLRVVDLERMADIGQRHGVCTVIDSTFATPINQRALEWGIDVVIHSATKYLSGHNDLLAGVVVGQGELIQTIREARGVLGNMIGPQAAFLLERGLKTLALRVRQQNATAQAVAEYLVGHPKIERVWYPGLPDHPDHAIAAAQMSGFGGVVTFEVTGTLAETSRFVDAMRIPYIAPSFGGVESLIEQPAIISYHDVPPQEQAAIGIKENLVRLAVGIEDTEDILDDLEQALSVL
jgi:cystathionine gamma-synthase